MRGFHIWPQNSNKITFDPLFGQKPAENRLNRIYCQLSTVFGKKGVRCYPISIRRPDLESSHHFGYIDPFWYAIFHFDFLTTYAFWRKNIPFATPKKVATHNKMIEHSKIWSQDSNRITFDPFLAKTVESCSITRLRLFLQFFFWPKGG